MFEGSIFGGWFLRIWATGVGFGSILEPSADLGDFAESLAGDLYYTFQGLGGGGMTELGIQFRI